MPNNQLRNLASLGRYGDTMLAHINPQEAALLKARGGAGTINPQTGLPEFFTLNQLPQVSLESLPSLGQALDPNSLANLSTKLNEVTTPSTGFGLNIKPATQQISPEYLDYADRSAPTGMGGGRQVEGYTIPVEQTFAGKPLVAQYDASGNFKQLTLKPGEYLTPDPSKPNIASVPKINAQGQLVDYGVFDLTKQDNGSFGSFLKNVATELGPMILAGIGANLFTGANLLGDAAGAAGGAAGGASAADIAASNALAQANLAGYAGTNLAATAAGATGASTLANLANAGAKTAAGGASAADIAAHNALAAANTAAGLTPEAVAAAAAGAGGASAADIAAHNALAAANTAAGLTPAAAAAAATAAGGGSLLSNVASGIGNAVSGAGNVASGIGNALSGAANVASGVLSANAAKDAAQIQADAALKAAQMQQDMFNTVNAQGAPYRGAGYNALNQIGQLGSGTYGIYDELGKKLVQELVQVI